jgi:uncharacterized protein YdeI (YjbR/CyaY-like superfamily)
MPDELPVLPFASQEEWKAWLRAHHASSDGLWLRFFKKGSGVDSVTYAEALDEALCHGWIDSQLRPYDEQSFLRKFTRRRPKSPWSKINQGHVARLTREKRMQRAGLKEVDAAKADGRWDAGYEPPSRTTMPADFEEALSKHRKAHAFFKTLNRANLYAIYYRLNAAKTTETRKRWIERFIQMLAKGETWHPVARKAKEISRRLRG